MVVRDKIDQQENLLNLFALSLVNTIDPASYIEQIWQNVYDWQREALDPSIKRLLLLCARQSGKSTIVAGRAAHTAKYKKKSLTIIVAPSKTQAEETMGKVKDFVRLDDELVISNHDSKSEVDFTNGSRIMVVTGTPKAVRGYSKPALIILDEAAYIDDMVYFSIRPMLTDNPDAVVAIISTPSGKQGFFYRAWHEGTTWHKIFVRPPFTLREDNKIVPFIKEATLRKKWRETGVSAYYSPRHTLEHLEEELEEIGALWWRQEYECEFVDNMNAVFSTDDIETAFDTNIKPLFSDEKEREDEIEQMEFDNVSWG